MTKPFIGVGAIGGALLGLLASIPDAMGVQLILVAIGMVAGIAVGGAIACISTKGRTTTSRHNAGASFGMAPEDLVRNYWRDQWRPRYLPALRPEDGRHQFDADKMW